MGNQTSTCNGFRIINFWRALGTVGIKVEFSVWCQRLTSLSYCIIKIRATERFLDVLEVSGKFALMSILTPSLLYREAH